MSLNELKYKPEPNWKALIISYRGIWSTLGIHTGELDDDTMIKLIKIWNEDE